MSEELVEETPTKVEAGITGNDKKVGKNFEIFSNNFYCKQLDSVGRILYDVFLLFSRI